MQTLRIISLLFFFAVVDFQADAQESDRRYWSVEVLEIKPTKSEAFQALMKDIAADLALQKYAYSYFMCKSTENKYFTIKEVLELSDTESMATATKNAWESMDKKLSKKYAKYVQQTERLIIKDLLEHSFIPDNPRLKWDDVVFARWEIHTVNKDQIDHYLEQMTIFQELMQAANHDDPAFLLSGVSGFDAPTYMMLQYGKDESDRKEQDKRLWEVIGDDGWKTFEELTSHIQEKKLVPFWILRELSYRAASNEENL